MKRQYNILLVDDHPLIREGYRKAFAIISKTYPDMLFEIEEAGSSEEVLHLLETWYQNHPLHLVFLDIKLPPDQKGVILSGEDLGLLLRKRFPNSKLAVITTFDNNYLIHSLIKHINPEGLMIKSDVNRDLMIQAVLDILDDGFHYSKTVVQSLKRQVAPQLILDSLDRQLLHQISLGHKTKDLPDYIPLSLAAIEKRKRKLKEAFGVESGNDIDLVLKAKEKGFL